MENKRILLVEDNPDDVELTLMALEAKNIGNTIDVVTDGEQALDYLFCRGKYADRSGEPLPALILLDLQLPKVSGLEVLKHLRADERTKILPVTIFTSSIEEQDMISSYELGANSYIRKPVDADQFEKAVEELGMYWLLLNEQPPNKG
jgi:two-component system response regulator